MFVVVVTYMRMSGSPVGLGTQISADYPQSHAFGLLQLRAFGSRKMLASLAARRIRRANADGDKLVSYVDCLYGCYIGLCVMS